MAGLSGLHFCSRTLCAWAEERRYLDARCAALFVRKAASSNRCPPSTFSNAATPDSTHDVLCGDSSSALDQAAGNRVDVPQRLDRDRAQDEGRGTDTTEDCGVGGQEELDQVTCIVDQGVYTRNRAFRLYLSSKFGKKAILLPLVETGAEGAASEPVCNIHATPCL